MKDTVKMSVNVSKDLHKQLKDEAKGRALSLNAVVIMVLEEYVKGKPKN